MRIAQARSFVLDLGISENIDHFIYHFLLVYLFIDHTVSQHFRRKLILHNFFSLTVYTTGGTANGAACVFPFLYKGHTYNNCTKVDHSTYWCSTTSDYAKGGNKWGNCPPVGEF